MPTTLSLSPLTILDAAPPDQVAAALEDIVGVVPIPFVIHAEHAVLDDL